MRNLEVKKERRTTTNNKNSFVISTCCVSFATESSSLSSPIQFLSPRLLTELKRKINIKSHNKLLTMERNSFSFIVKCPHNEKLKINRMMSNNSRPHNEWVKRSACAEISINGQSDWWPSVEKRHQRSWIDQWRELQIERSSSIKMNIFNILPKKD